MNDFDKIDLRVGTIIDAYAHPESKKLLVFTVDLGFEKRQILSGCQKWYKPSTIHVVGPLGTPR